MRLLNLPIDVEYELMDVYDAGEITTSCQNCNMPIRNIATIKSSKGSFDVGLDCATSLCNDAGNQWHLEQQIKTAKKEIARVVKAKRLIALGGTPTRFGKTIVVCYRKPNDSWPMRFEVTPMFSTANTKFTQQFIDSFGELPRLDCLASGRDFATTLTA